MVQGINNNGSGLFQSLNKSQNNQQTALERLASGKKVNRAADNAAALAIINRYTSQINGSAQAARNSSDAISLTQVAESAVSGITEDVQRIRELSLQSANGTLGDSARSALQAEVSQLQEEINRRYEQTRFGDVDVLNTDNNFSIQVGPNAGDTIDVSTQDIGDDIAAIIAIDISTAAGANSALGTIDPVLQSLDQQQGAYGAVSNRFESVISNLGASLVNTEEARSRLADADFARESSELAKSSIQQEAGIAAKAQANTSARLVLNYLS